MELDEIKKNWAQYDKKLSYNINLNETLLRKINLKGSKGEMRILLFYEIFNIVFCIIAIAVVLWYSGYYINQLQFSIPGFFAAFITAIYMVFSIIKTKILLKIDYYGSPVVEVQRGILRLKKSSLRLRKYELILMPLLMFPLLPLYAKVQYNFDIYNHIPFVLAVSVVMLAISYIIVVLIYKYFYDKKFKKVEKFLKELEDFENDKGEI